MGHGDVLVPRRWGYAIVSRWNGRREVREDDCFKSGYFFRKHLWTGPDGPCRRCAELRPETGVTTMLMNGVEHAVVAYNDDNGHGLALCDARIGPWDVGPRQDEKITCPKCLEVQRKNRKRVS